MVYDGSTKKVVEYIVEDSFGTLPADPDFQNFGGYVTSATIKKTMVPAKFPYLKDDDDTNRLQSTKTQKVSEAFAATINMNPTDWSILPIILCAATTTTYAIGDNVYDIALGSIVNDQYEPLAGGCFNKFECTIAEDAVAECVLEGMFATHTAESATDYVTGAGTHASTPTGDAIKFGDLTAVEYDDATTAANGISIDNIKFGVEYAADPIKDVGSANESKIGAWGYGQRNITLELNMTLDSMLAAPDILDGVGHKFEFTAGGKSFTFDDIIWDGDWDKVLNPDDVIAMPLAASNVDLTIV